MTFSVATLSSGERLSSAVVIGDRVWHVEPIARLTGLRLMSGTLFDYLQEWEVVFPQLEQLVEKIKFGAVSPSFSSAMKEVEFAAPVSKPRKVFAIGANYQSHVDEMAAMLQKQVKEMAMPPAPDTSKPPFFFLKPGSTLVAGPGATVHMPPKRDNLDWEGEVAVVFGKRGRGIQPEHALEQVAGYTLAIDFTARNQMEIPSHIFRWDFVLGKCQDTLTPTGPVFVPKQVVDGSDFAFTLSVNGAQRHATSTRNRMYSLAQMFARVSEGVSIEPGDRMLTGSPAGVGRATGDRLAIGDIVVVDSPATGSMAVTIQPPL